MLARSFLALLLPLLARGALMGGTRSGLPVVSRAGAAPRLAATPLPAIARLRGGGDEPPFVVFVAVEIEPSRVEEFIKVMNIDAAGAWRLCQLPPAPGHRAERAVADCMIAHRCLDFCRLPDRGGLPALRPASRPGTGQQVLLL